MSKKYFVWKDSACNGKNIEWLEISGREFYKMMKLPENKKRRFVCLGNDICQEADVIYMESTEENYVEWRKEQNAHRFIARGNSAYRTISLDQSINNENDDESLLWEIADTAIDVEKTAEFNYQFSKRREKLTDDENVLFTEIFILEKTGVEVAKNRGVTPSAVSQKRKRITKKMSGDY